MAEDGDRKAVPSERDVRLAAALRANLRRRRDQAREREAGGPEEADADADAPAVVLSPPDAPAK